MKLHRHLFVELGLAFLFTLGGIITLVLPAAAAAAVQQLSGVPIVVVLSFVPLVLAGLVPYAVPLAFLLAVVQVYGRVSADNEWTSLRMSGRNPFAIFGAGLAMATVLGVSMLWLLDVVLPDIRYTQNVSTASALATITRVINPARTEVKIKDFYLSARSRAGDDFLDAIVFVPKSKERDEPWTAHSDRVHFSSEGSDLYANLSGTRHISDGKDVTVGDMVVRIELEALRGKANARDKPRYLRSSEIETEIAEGRVAPAKVDVFRFEIQQRRAMAATCLMFFLLGAPMALMVQRRTRLLPLAIATGYALIYYVLSMRLGLILSQAHVVPPAIAAWVVVLAGTGIGSLLVWKATRH